MESDPPLYDVFLVNKETREIMAMVARRTHLNDGYHSAMRYRNTWLARADDGTVVEIAPTGKFHRGAVLPVEGCAVC